jgi:hypothetical protein
MDRIGGIGPWQDVWFVLESDGLPARYADARRRFQHRDGALCNQQEALTGDPVGASVIVTVGCHVLERAAAYEFGELVGGINPDGARASDFAVVGKEHDPTCSQFVGDQVPHLIFENPDALGLTPLPRNELANQALPVDGFEERSPAWPQGTVHGVHRRPVLLRWLREPEDWDERDDGIERTTEWNPAKIPPDPLDRQALRLRSPLTLGQELVGDIKAGDIKAAPGEFERVIPWAAGEIEDRCVRG